MCQLISAQLNIKVAYDLAFVSAKENNELLQAYNAAKASEVNFTKEFGSLNSMNGIVLGLRYKFNPVHSLELGWVNLSNSKEAVGELNMGNLFRQKLYYSSNQYYLDYQTHFSSIGVGIGIATGSFKIRDEIGNSDVKKQIVKEDQWIFRSNISFYFSGHSNVSFCLQPYLNIALDAVDLNPLKNELQLTDNSDPSSGFSHFGLRFIFYNGPQ